MRQNWPDLALPVEKIGVRVRTNLDRFVWRLAHDKKDHETVARWVLRGARRLGACPVDDPELHYRATADSGPDGMWTAIVRVLKPETEAQRQMFATLRLPRSLSVFRFMDPDYQPPIAEWLNQQAAAVQSEKERQR